MTTTTTQKITMDGQTYRTLRAAIKAHPTSGALWIDEEEYTYYVDGSTASVYDGEGDEAYRVTL